jgi:hypothetical protein
MALTSDLELGAGHLVGGWEAGCSLEGLTGVILDPAPHVLEAAYASLWSAPGSLATTRFHHRDPVHGQFPVAYRTGLHGTCTLHLGTGHGCTLRIPTTQPLSAVEEISRTWPRYNERALDPVGARSGNGDVAEESW